MSEDTDVLFSVLAEKKGYEKTLIVTDLTFARLIDDIVKPYEEDAAFFIDGVPIKRNEVQKLKIIREFQNLQGVLEDFFEKLKYGGVESRRLIGEQYEVRLDALLRENGEDVTSQIIKAFDSEIKPGLKNYLPKRDELIQAASKIFWEGINSLGGGT